MKFKTVSEEEKIIKTEKSTRKVGVKEKER
jgi:hypothetical protein